MQRWTLHKLAPVEGSSHEDSIFFGMRLVILPFCGWIRLASPGTKWALGAQLLNFRPSYVHMSGAVSSGLCFGRGGESCRDGLALDTGHV